MFCARRTARTGAWTHGPTDPRFAPVVWLCSCCAREAVQGATWAELESVPPLPPASACHGPCMQPVPLDIKEDDAVIRVCFVSSGLKTWYRTWPHRDLHTCRDTSCTSSSFDGPCAWHFSAQCITDMCNSKRYRRYKRTGLDRRATLPGADWLAGTRRRSAGGNLKPKGWLSASGWISEEKKMEEKRPAWLSVEEPEPAPLGFPLTNLNFSGLAAIFSGRPAALRHGLMTASEPAFQGSRISSVRDVVHFLMSGDEGIGGEHACLEETRILGCDGKRGCCSPGSSLQTHAWWCSKRWSCSLPPFPQPLHGRQFDLSPEPSRRTWRRPHRLHCLERAPLLLRLLGVLRRSTRYEVLRVLQCTVDRLSSGFCTAVYCWWSMVLFTV